MNPSTPAHLKSYSKELRNSSTKSEQILWNQLKNQKLGFRFVRQKIILSYIVDFYCPKLRLIIEIDGITHDFKSEQDEVRDDKLRAKGDIVLRIVDSDVFNNLDGVMVYIRDFMSKF